MQIQENSKIIGLTPLRCGQLKRILDQELLENNTVKHTSNATWQRCQTMVVLRTRFSRLYENEADFGEDLEMDVNKDPHYPVGKSYYCPIHEEALIAPF
ncbi:MAG: hypothetical protein PF692_08590 [Kiritimatiellae bacterium]|jgi:hypothetical protein|nr:hypothetical protein [Kiritimatiellia bacterium]